MTQSDPSTQQSAPTPPPRPQETPGSQGDQQTAQLIGTLQQSLDSMAQTLQQMASRLEQMQTEGVPCKLA